jgi:hypothetical protein
MGLIKVKKLISLLRNYAEDIFIAAGLVFINLATFQLNTTAGLYSIGASCIVIGVVLARHPPGRR